MRKASQKVEDGKMVKIGLEVNEEKVEGVEIRGDFFLQPPEKLEEVEKKIEGLKIDSTAKEVKDSLSELDAEMIGFSPEDIGKAFRKAVDSEEDE